MTAHRFGLIGHGAVGSLFARLLAEHGARVVAYDVRDRVREVQRDAEVV